ncbi:zinc finger, CCHC-type containing protein [Tanacetum coccineum]
MRPWANIDADHQLAERLQAQEQEELFVEEKATLFQQLLEKRRKHFAAKTAEEKRNKPPTKAQLRKIMERTRLRLFQFSLRDQASNWLERLPAGSITTWEDLTTRFLAQFFPPRRTTKLRNDNLMFQQHHGESLSEA